MASGSQAFNMGPYPDYYTLKATIWGGAINLYIDDVPLVGPDGPAKPTYTDTVPIATGKVALRVRNAWAWFDDVYEGPLTYYTYDPSNQLIGVGNPDGSTIGYTYDVNGNRTQANTKDPLGNIIQAIAYDYDRANQLTVIRDAQSGNITQSLSYDSSGNTAFDGATYTYDAG